MLIGLARSTGGTVGVGQVTPAAKRLARQVRRAEGELFALTKRARVFSNRATTVGRELRRIATDARNLAAHRSSQEMGALGMAIAVLKAHVGPLVQEMWTVCRHG